MSGPRTAALYQAALPAGAVLVACLLLGLAYRHAAVDAGICLLSLVPLGVGIGLLVNWRGGTDEIRSRSGETLLSTVPSYALRFGGLVLAGVALVVLARAVYDLATHATTF